MCMPCAKKTVISDGVLLYRDFYSKMSLECSFIQIHFSQERVIFGCRVTQDGSHCKTTHNVKDDGKLSIEHFDLVLNVSTSHRIFDLVLNVSTWYCTLTSSVPPQGERPFTSPSPLNPLNANPLTVTSYANGNVSIAKRHTTTFSKTQRKTSTLLPLFSAWSTVAAWSKLATKKRPSMLFSTWNTRPRGTPDGYERQRSRFDAPEYCPGTPRCFLSTLCLQR